VPKKVLIYGIGNPGREDDGLGPRFVQALSEVMEIPGLNFESNYQLNIEDAYLVAQMDVVYFVDATMEKGAATPYGIRTLKPSAQLEFTTHAMDPRAVLSLCEELYGKKPEVFLVTLPGHGWEVSTELTSIATENLKRALAAFPGELRACMNSP